MADEPTIESLRAKQERGEDITMDYVPKSICEVLLDVLVEHGLHTPVPRGIKPPPLVVALYLAADRYEEPVRERLASWVKEARDSAEVATTFLASIASAQSQGTQEQTDWMIAQAREGLRRAGGHDFDASGASQEPGGR
jgi:hypothetical protein